MLMQWDFLIAGCSGAGKSSLIAALLQEPTAVMKTQSIVFHGKRYVDMPGEYLTHPYLRKQFFSAAAQAKAILFLLAADALPSRLPSAFFRQIVHAPCFGLISKADMHEGDIPRAKRELVRLGLREPFFDVSIYDEDKLERIRALTAPRQAAQRTEKYHEA